MRRNSYGTTRIFGEQELRSYLETKKDRVIANIGSETDDYILNVNETDYVTFKVSQAEVEEIAIHDEKVYASSSEQMIPAEYFSRLFNVSPGNSYKKDVIKFHVPFSGNKDLLSCIPSSRILWSVGVEINEDEFCFEIINFSDDVDSIVREKDSNISSILKQCINVNSQVTQYNSSLEAQVHSAFKARKERILAKTGVLASLGVPIKKSASTPETFAIATTKKRKQVKISKPSVNEVGYKPEPSLDNSVYQDILQIVHDTGKEFERLPSVYVGKEEEHLRDHMLMMLEPNFEGSATGETFNKSGKTDILLRHDGTNVFIGECKFWKGQKSFLSTISQLLGYLTWRDSKAAVIMFVPNKEFSTVLETAKSSVSSHKNFLRIVDESDETWFNCEFHLDDDRNRIIKVAIMLYHTPKANNE